MRQEEISMRPDWDETGCGTHSFSSMPQLCVRFSRLLVVYFQFGSLINNTILRQNIKAKKLKLFILEKWVLPLNSLRSWWFLVIRASGKPSK